MKNLNHFAKLMSTPTEEYIGTSPSGLQTKEIRKRRRPQASRKEAGSLGPLAATAGCTASPPPPAEAMAAALLFFLRWIAGLDGYFPDRLHRALPKVTKPNFC